MITIKIGGVPEHFNLPWRLLLEAGEPARSGIDAHWQDFPDGSGAMAAALRDERLDVAMLLTEGAVAGVARRRAQDREPVHRVAADLGHSRAGCIETAHRGRHSRRALCDQPPRLRLASDVVRARARSRVGRPPASSFVVVRNLQGAIDAFDVGRGRRVFLGEVHDEARRRRGAFPARRRVRRAVARVRRVRVARRARDEGRRDRRAAANGVRGAPRGSRRARTAPRRSRRVTVSRFADVRDWLATTRWATRPGIDAAHVAPAVAALHVLDLVDARSLRPICSRRFRAA